MLVSIKMTLSFGLWGEAQAEWPQGTQPFPRRKKRMDEFVGIAVA